MASSCACANPAVCKARRNSPWARPVVGKFTTAVTPRAASSWNRASPPRNGPVRRKAARKGGGGGDGGVRGGGGRPGKPVEQGLVDAADRQDADEVAEIRCQTRQMRRQ